MIFGLLYELPEQVTFENLIISLKDLFYLILICKMHNTEYENK